MSHFTTVQVQFKNVPLLKRVLEMHGHSVKENALVRGYQGNKTRAELVVQRANGYDLGFRRQGEHVEMVADFWGTGITAAEFLAPIRQDYARQQLYETAAAQGFAIDSETVDEQGEIKIVIGRWT